MLCDFNMPIYLNFNTDMKKLIRRIRTIFYNILGINRKDKDGQTQLHKAVINDKIGTIKSLIDKGAQLDIPDIHGQTPLHVAAGKGNTEAIKTLIDKGADVNAQDNQAQTPLHVAATNNQIEAALTLIDKGADSTIRDNSGKTASEKASSHGQTEISGLIRNMALLKDHQPQKEAKNSGHNLAANLRSKRHDKSFKSLVYIVEKLTKASARSERKKGCNIS